MKDLRTCCKWLHNEQHNINISAETNLEDYVHVQSVLYIQWHCNITLKIHLSLLSELMYIILSYTSISMHGSVEFCFTSVANMYKFIIIMDAIYRIRLKAC